MNGFLLIDKPQGITSFGVVARVRRTLGVDKIGHCGTLDPLATGLLILCLGKATKLAQFVSRDRKSYRAEITLGATSTTYDRDGELTAVLSADIPTREQTEKALSRFVGDIEQSAPAYSAVKHQGKPLYKYARKNQTVETKSRSVHVERIEVIEFSYPRLVLDLTCSSGTYVRSIAHDLGQALGCGAYVSQLRRTAVGRWRIERAITLDRLPAGDASVPYTTSLFGDAYVPMEQMLEMPTVHVAALRAAQVTQGVPLRPQDLTDMDLSLVEGQLVALKGLQDELLAIGRLRRSMPSIADRSDEPVLEYVRVM